MEAATQLLESTFRTECPMYPRFTHSEEISGGDTRLWNYWEWVAHQIESDNFTVEAFIAISAKAIYVVFEWVYPDEDGGTAHAAVNATTGEVTLFEATPNDIAQESVRKRIWFDAVTCVDTVALFQNTCDGADYAVTRTGDAWFVKMADLAEMLGEIASEPVVAAPKGVVTKSGFMDSAGTYYPSLVSVRTYMPKGRTIEPANDPLRPQAHASDALNDPAFRQQTQGLKDMTAAIEGVSSSPVVFSTDAGSILNTTSATGNPDELPTFTPYEQMSTEQKAAYDARQGISLSDRHCIELKMPIA